MKIVKWTEAILLSLSLMLGFAAFSHADETVGEKVEEGAKDMKKGAKKAWRNTKDETCEWINGKMECAGKKVKNKAKNVGDEVKDKVDAD